MKKFNDYRDELIGGSFCKASLDAKLRHAPFQPGSGIGFCFCLNLAPQGAVLDTDSLKYAGN